jgi:hypothetical protein
MLFPSALRMGLLSTLAIAATIITRSRDHVHTKIQLPKAPPQGPSPALLIKYANAQNCYSTLTTQPKPQTLSYTVDTCYNLTPGEVVKIKITSSAICADGRKAEFTTFSLPFCVGPHTPMVTEAIVGKCLDAYQTFSMGFVCNGIPEISGMEDLTKMAGYLIGIFSLALTLMFLLLCCGGLTVAGGLLGLIGWGLWSLVRLVKVGCIE